MSTEAEGKPFVLYVQLLTLLVFAAY